MIAESKISPRSDTIPRHLNLVLNHEIPLEIIILFFRLLVRNTIVFFSLKELIIYKHIKFIENTKKNSNFFLENQKKVGKSQESQRKSEKFSRKSVESHRKSRKLTETHGNSRKVMRKYFVTFELLCIGFLTRSKIQLMSIPNRQIPPVSGISIFHRLLWQLLLKLFMLLLKLQVLPPGLQEILHV